MKTQLVEALEKSKENVVEEAKEALIKTDQAQKPPTQYDKYVEQVELMIEDEQSFGYHDLCKNLDEAYVPKEYGTKSIEDGLKMTLNSNLILPTDNLNPGESHKRTTSRETVGSDPSSNLSGSRDADKEIGNQGGKRKKKIKIDEKNPFLEFGVAIENFFKLEVYLIALFTICAILAIPQMGIFWSYNSR